MDHDDVHGLIVDLRGGVSECCDFCGQKFTEQNYAMPEEGGDWACIECVKRWDKQDQIRHAMIRARTNPRGETK